MTTNVIALVRPVALEVPSLGELSNSETLRLQGLATNALSTALHLLCKLDTTPAELQRATARAVRAATLLKQATSTVATPSNLLCSSN